MRRIKLLGLALVAVFASAAALATSASALELPENLPVSAVTRNWTGESDDPGKVIELLSPGLKTNCTEAAATGTEEAKKPLGLFHIEFKNCTAAGAKCTGTGDATAGVILSLGTWHLVFDKVGPKELLTAILFLLELVTFKCSALVEVDVLGELLCLELEPTVSKVTHLFHCVVLLVGEKKVETQEDTKWCMKDKEEKCVEELTAELLCSINKGAHSKCFELALGTVTEKDPIFADI